MVWTVVIAAVVIYVLLQRFIRSQTVGNYRDKYVFITGCDTGFGRALALRLDSLGFHVFAGCLSEDAAKSLSQSSSRLQTVPLDISSVGSIEEAVEVLKKSLPAEKGLWALVNNAGVGGSWAPSEMCTKKDYTFVFDINFFGLTEITRLCLPLVRQARGRVVNMASAAGRVAFVAAPYTCSKYAVEAYSDVLRREMRKHGVKVSVLEPGIFRTAIVNVERMMDLVKASRDKSPPDVQQFYGPGVLDRYRERFIGFFDGGSSDINLVVDAYAHAITARFPHRRYALGSDCRYIFIPLTYLPDWFADLFIHFQIYRKGP